MTNHFDFENDPDYKKLDIRDRLAILKTYITGRDSKTGRFVKGRSGNTKGRPRVRTTLSACLNKSFSQKATIEIDGKTVVTTNLQLACDMILQTSLAERDIKTLIQLLKTFGSAVNLSEEFPPPKVRPPKEDPSVEMIREAILHSLDKEFGVNTDDDNDLIE